MFERFTREARSVVVEAQSQAVRDDADEITTIHLLTALHVDPAATAARVLTEHGVPAETLAEDLRAMRRRAGLSGQDVAALGALGIDVEEVIGRVERAHGEYALAGRRAPRRGFFGAKDHRPFAQEAKTALRRALREASELRDQRIGSEHVLMALVGQHGPARDLLAARGVDHSLVRREVAQRGRER